MQRRKNILTDRNEETDTKIKRERERERERETKEADELLRLKAIVKFDRD